MAASIVVNWGFGLLIETAAGATRRKRFLVVGVCLNLSGLAVFKYAGFFYDNLNRILSSLDVSWRFASPPLHLPIGISFFTFQALTYLIDIYRRMAPAERNVLRAALYIAFFPQLIAGPILRYADIGPQIRSRPPTGTAFVTGIERFILGLAKKVLLANTFAVAADAGFSSSVGELSAVDAWLAALAYSLQIYFDFSGYSDMAIGLGFMFGFRFPENFKYPYVSRSLSEFWRRWHITLSAWFRDYLYIPLGGNRFGRARTYINLWVVFLLCGLWHGAAWTFVSWGAIHGAFLVMERAGLERALCRLRGPAVLLAHAYTLLVVVVAWVFFRAHSVQEALEFITVMFAGAGAPLAHVAGLDRKLMAAFVVGIGAATPLGDWCMRRLERSARAQGARFVGAIMLLALLWLCAMALAGGTHNPFIYFRF
jgi:alginate O-acetyltransferase complex protein AlgI